MPTVLPPILNAEKLPSPIWLTGSLTDEQKQELLVQLLGESHRKKILSGVHPDVHIYAPEEKSGLYAITTIRAFIKEMGLPPFEAKRKAFFLLEADKMLPPSSNALLKTLEEPSDDSFIVLFTEYPQTLLPTIRSRLYPIAVSRSEVGAADMTSYITMAQNQQWPELFEMLAEIEDGQAESLLKGCLGWAAQQKDPRFFSAISILLTEAQTALSHNIKLINILINVFISLS